MSTDPNALIEKFTREDAGVWFETHAKIWPKDRSGGMVRPISNYLQKKIQKIFAKLEEMDLAVRLLLLKPRQKGSTTYCAAFDYHMLRRYSTSACVIGGQYTQTDSIWEMIQTYKGQDTFPWPNTGDVNEKEGKFSHGSTLQKETANDALAGVSKTLQLVHGTEVARWAKYGLKEAATVLANLLKCVPLLPRTVVILETTAEGAEGDFYIRWLSAIDADAFLAGTVVPKPGQYIRIFAAWFQFEDSGIRLKPEEKREIEKTLDAEDWYVGEQELIARYGVIGDDGVMRLGETVRSHDVWEQLYWRRYEIEIECKKDRAVFDQDFPHSWEDAFLKSGRMRFNAKGVVEMVKKMKQKIGRWGILETDRLNRFIFRQTDPGEAQVIIYEEPIEGCKYILVVDPMTGESQTTGEDPDFHGAGVIRDAYIDKQGKWQRKALVARVLPCRWDIDVIEVPIWRLAKKYGGRLGCKIVIEMNMDRGLTELLKLRGADLYQREVWDEKEQRKKKALGVTTGGKTREMFIEALAKCIREWDDPEESIDIWDPNAVKQVQNFIINEKGKSTAAAHHHDDDVLFISIGTFLIQHATTYWKPRGELPPEMRALYGDSNQPRGGAYS